MTDICWNVGTSIDISHLQKQRAEVATCDEKPEYLSVSDESTPTYRQRRLLCIAFR